MEIKYKPTKPKKEKSIKAPKAEKAAKPMSFGSAHAVKIDKPKKVKEPKTKASKPEKTVTFTPIKVEKAQKFERADKLKQPVNPKILIAVTVVLVVLTIVVAVLLLWPGEDTEEIGSLQSLEILELPNQIAYEVGEEANWYGLKIKASLNGGIVAVLEAKDCIVTGFDSSKAAEVQTITVTYKGLSTSFVISVTEGEGSSASTGQYVGVSMHTLPKTEYKVNEWLNVSGGSLLVHYDDGTTKVIDLDRDEVKGFTSSKPGTYTLTVKHEERGYLYETTYTITVTE